jgi:hypothetical protein
MQQVMKSELPLCLKGPLSQQCQWMFWETLKQQFVIAVTLQHD